MLDTLSNTFWYKSCILVTKYKTYNFSGQQNPEETHTDIRICPFWKDPDHHTLGSNPWPVKSPNFKLQIHVNGCIRRDNMTWWTIDPAKPIRNQSECIFYLTCSLFIKQKIRVPLSPLQRLEILTFPYQENETFHTQCSFLDIELTGEANMTSLKNKTIKPRGRHSKI